MDSRMPRYQPSRIEPKWQAWWDAHGTFATPRLPTGRKLYALDMFPYPSGDGLHVGHPEGYTATDIVSRFERMRGTNVMHPMGFDAFGLPAEEYAIRTGTPPRESTNRNIETFTRQLKMLGFSYDWNRVLATTDPEYVRWTQWIFLVLFDSWFDPALHKGRPIADLPIPADVAAQGEQAVAAYRDGHRLAYQSEAPVNWCPALGTVLANEEVIGGVSERGGHPVVRIPLRQWMLRITAYADRLETELDGLDWPASIKKLQCDWIGRSTGAEVDFLVPPAAGADGAFATWKETRAAAGFSEKPGPDVLRIYTTRPDTLYGVTYMVIAPEHPLVDTLTTPGQRGAIDAYREAAARKSDLDRTDLAREKTGVFTGSSVIHPLTGKPVPVWVADYVLASYGTGAIMAVPAHDDRDFEFATTFGLDVVTVVQPEDGPTAAGTLFTGDGRAVNSGPYTGLATQDFSAGSGFGASRSRSSTNSTRPAIRRASSAPSTSVTSPCRSLNSPTSSRATRPTRRSRGRARTGCSSSATANAIGAKPTRCRSGRVRAGITCGSSTRETPIDSSIQLSSRPGCRWTSTSAVRSMPCSTSSTHGSGTRCSMTAATCRAPSRSASWSTRA